MNRKTVLIYLLIFILAFIGFAFVCFPGREAGIRLTEMLKSRRTDLQFAVGSVKPALPLGLSFQDTIISLNKELKIVPDGVKIGFSPMSLFRSEKKLTVRAELNRGLVKGNLKVKSLDPLKISESEFFLEKININGFKYHSPLAEVTLSCDLSGEYHEDLVDDPPGSPAKPLKGKAGRKNPGHGTLVMENFSAHMENSWLNMINFPEIDFSSLTIEFVRYPQRLVITRCAGRGSMLNLRLKGDIRLASSAQKTRLNLTGKILPDSPYLARFANQAAIRSRAGNISRNGIEFYIKGTLENPRIGI
ncbi:type II secretion system protein GspN [Desulfospira joergensenii]|uniref:type II secretion system protein GspN n=1 Tax=Desulfospira joergensenii TaxID=53329 RepID=UPI0003B4C86E|nr:type II secretion system protein GspN [Desulfospira joergensenii]